MFVELRVKIPQKELCCSSLSQGEVMEDIEKEVEDDLVNEEEAILLAIIVDNQDIWQETSNNL